MKKTMLLLLLSFLSCRDKQSGFKCGELIDGSTTVRKCDEPEVVCICSNNSCAERVSTQICPSGFQYLEPETHFSSEDGCVDIIEARSQLTGANSCSELTFCGNGILEANEECDDGNDNFKDSCVIDETSDLLCKKAICGDGIVRIDITNENSVSFEECDSQNLNDKGCEDIDPAKPNGILSCNNTCRFNATQCIK